MASTEHRSSARAERVTTIEAIEATALAMIDEEGLDGLSFRKLAQKLGVGTMSLYRYVATKDELLDRVAVLACKGVLPVDHDDKQWDELLPDMMRRLDRALLLHPRVAPLIIGRVAPLATLNPFREIMIAALRGAGFPIERAAMITSALVAYVSGNVMLESGVRTNDVSSDAPEFDAARFPSLNEAKRYYDGLSVDEAQRTRFELGLRLLLIGIRAELTG